MFNCSFDLQVIRLFDPLDVEALCGKVQTGRCSPAALFSRHAMCACHEEKLLDGTASLLLSRFYGRAVPIVFACEKNYQRICRGILCCRQLAQCHLYRKQSA